MQLWETFGTKRTVIRGARVLIHYGYLSLKGYIFMFHFQSASLMSLFQLFISRKKVDLCMTQSSIKPFQKYVKIQGRGNTIIQNLPQRVNGLVVRSIGKLGNIYNLVTLYYNTNSFKY